MHAWGSASQKAPRGGKGPGTPRHPQTESLAAPHTREQSYRAWELPFTTSRRQRCTVDSGGVWGAWINHSIVFVQSPSWVTSLSKPWPPLCSVCLPNRAVEFQGCSQFPKDDITPHRNCARKRGEEGVKWRKQEISKLLKLPKNNFVLILPMIRCAVQIEECNNNDNASDITWSCKGMAVMTELRKRAWITIWSMLPVGMCAPWTSWMCFLRKAERWIFYYGIFQHNVPVLSVAYTTQTFFERFMGCGLTRKRLWQLSNYSKMKLRCCMTEIAPPAYLIAHVNHLESS